MARRSRVLVAYASKMGSTKEIAEVIGEELEAAGLQATVVSCAEDPGVDDFDGVIIGSAISPAAGSRQRPNTSNGISTASTPKEHGCFIADRAEKERAGSRSARQRLWSG